MKNSEVVVALATMASQGKYTVDKQGAANMTLLYQEVARLINELEAGEAMDGLPSGIVEGEDSE